MDPIDTSPPKLGRLVEQRLALVCSLAESLESSSTALARNDAEAIARGAAHQAEFCRQWERLEGQLRRKVRQRSAQPSPDTAGSLEADHSARLQAEWEALGTRIQYLTRVHRSLLRHLQRSLAVMSRVVDSCALTYTPDPGLLRIEMRTEVLPQVRTEVRLGSGSAGE